MSLRRAPELLRRAPELLLGPARSRGSCKLGQGQDSEASCNANEAEMTQGSLSGKYRGTLPLAS